MEKKYKLEKRLSVLDVLALALGSIIGWGAFVMPGTTFLPKAGPLGSIIGLCIGGVIMIIIAMAYGYMIEKYPVAGGEYSYAKEIFGEKHGFICGWFLSLSYLAIIPLNATALGLVSRKLLGNILEVGFLYEMCGYEIYLGEVVFASLALVLVAYFVNRGVHVNGKLQSAITFSLVGSVLLILVGLLFNGNVEWSNLKPSFNSEIGPMHGILMIVAISPWAFVGFDSIPQAAEEFNFSPKKARGIMIIAILFAVIVYSIINIATAVAMPWEDLLRANFDWPTGEAVEMIMGKIGLFILGVSIIAAIMSGMLGFYMASSRLIYSMGRENMLPKCFGKINGKTGSPTNAIILITSISLIAPWFGREVLNWVVDMSSIGAAIGYGYTAASTLFLILKNKENKVGLGVLSGLGVIFSLGFIAMLLIPNMPSYLALESRIMLIIWITLGVIFYFKGKKEKSF